jgi:hypothetical protein
VIQAWDHGGNHDWTLRSELLTACREELARRAVSEQCLLPSCDREFAIA